MAENFGFQKVANIKKKNFSISENSFLKIIILTKDESFIYLFKNIISKINKNFLYKK